MNDDERQLEPETVDIGGTDTSPPAYPNRFAKGNRYSPGGKVGNVCGQTHGLSSWLKSGSLPDSARHVRSVVKKFRELLESAVIDRHDQITLTQAAMIQTATTNEGARQLVLRYLRMEEKTLPLSDRLACLDRVTKFSAARDAAMEKLKLDVKDRNDIWANVLDATPKVVEGSAS